MGLPKIFFAALAFVVGLLLGQGMPHLFPEILGAFGPFILAIGMAVGVFLFEEGGGSPLLMGMGFVGMIGAVETELPWFAYWILCVIFIFVVYKFRG